jgi:cell pole-organizing protein PopZ
MSSPQHEPTMEEILASIRKIISEDAPGPSPVEMPPEPAPIEADVLELTQEVVEEPVPAPIPVPPPPQPAPAPVDDIVFQPDPAPAPVAPAPAPPSNDIFSDHTRKAIDDAFAKLSEEDEVPEPQPAPRAAPLPPVNGATVESVFERAVRDSFEPVLKSHLTDNSSAIIEAMKPAIREWMDQNFPALLENAVRTEVERVVRSRKR